MRLAEKHGAVAMLLFPFPEDVISNNETGYPDSWGLKGDAMPRGSINLAKGDPLTPEWPSKGEMFIYFYNKKNFKYIKMKKKDKLYFMKNVFED